MAAAGTESPARRRGRARPIGARAHDWGRGLRETAAVSVRASNAGPYELDPIRLMKGVSVSPSQRILTTRGCSRQLELPIVRHRNATRPPGRLDRHDFSSDRMVSADVPRRRARLALGDDAVRGSAKVTARPWRHVDRA